jgi:hypothetical protein
MAFLLLPTLLERRRESTTAPRAQARRQRLLSPPICGRVPDVLAYLDPGTGSMLVQLIVGGFAAAGVAIKVYWRRLTRLLRIRKDEPELRPAEPDRDG